MRFSAFLGVAAAAVLLVGAAPPSPEQAWRSGIDEENRDYAQVQHAMLKIQDAAYLADGNSAVLTGRKGDPGSYRWSSKPDAAGVVRVSLQGGKIAGTRDGVSFGADALAKGVPVDKDVDLTGEPTQIGAGVQGWRIFVFNQQNPAATMFKGVSYFPYDPAYRVTARFVADPKRPARVFRTSRGTDKRFYRVGEAQFSLGGKAITLPMYAGTNDPAHIQSATAFFMDELTGKGAYDAGRYVDASDFGRFPPATVILDFNTAYNPNCARSAHFTCPIAMDDIPVAIKAGERDPHAAQ